MVGGEQQGAEVRTVTYCLVPGDLAATLHEPLRRHFKDDPSVEVVVERRGRERRAGQERRDADASKPDTDRRAIRAVEGRRVADRRLSLATVDAPPLPRRARPHTERLVFAERLEPSGQRAEDIDTAHVVTRFQAGDSEAFALLYLRYFDRVYGYLRLLLRDRDLSEEAAQQVFLRAFEALPGYERRRQPFRAWLFTIARNLALTQLSRQGRLDLTEPAELSRRQESLHTQEFEFGWISDRELMMFVERLPQQQQQVLVLRHMLDLTTGETARVLGLTPVAVRSLHYRAMRVLERRLTAIGRGPESRRVPMRAGVRQAPVLRLRRFALIGQ